MAYDLYVCVTFVELFELSKAPVKQKFQFCHFHMCFVVTPPVDILPNRFPFHSSS